MAKAGKIISRWAWVAGVWLMLLLGVVSGHSHTFHDSGQIAPANSVELFASGNTTSGTFKYASTYRGLTPVVLPTDHGPATTLYLSSRG